MARRPVQFFYPTGGDRGRGREVPRPARINRKVTCWRLPGIDGFNFLLPQVLGGGMASLMGDSQTFVNANPVGRWRGRLPFSASSRLQRFISFDTVDRSI